jgi:uncharacterized membrane protein
LQSIMLFMVIMVFHVLTGFIPVIGVISGSLVTLLGVLLWLLLMFTTLQGKWVKLPWIGELAERQLQRM